MNKIIKIQAVVVLLFFTATAFAGISVIPRPNKITELPGQVKLSWPLTPEQITFNSGGDHAKEGYTLLISKTGVVIEANCASGKFYAEQTLKQLVLLSKDGTVPCLKIEDAPRYRWRGFMLDESRHFFGKKKVKQILDQMAMLKLNRFHWHLTDSQGWRIEIKKYPKLTEIGAIGNQGNKSAPASFYTQEDIKEIVNYASERFITIVPEIDMPGHAAAAARAYPEISGGGSKTRPHFTFNPGSEKTYQFLTDVLTEVASLFPSKWLHYGGDEVHYANEQWIDIPDVKELMDREKLQNLEQVELYFNRRMADVIAQLGRTTVGWDEITRAGLDTDNTLIMWWRHHKKSVLKDAFEKKHNVVLCPSLPCYFDFVQDNSHTTGRRWKKKHFNTLEDVYIMPAGLDLVESQVIGIQANLWTETVVTEKRLDFMIFPRLLALSEASWTLPNNKNYNHFLDRLKTHLPYMKSEGVYYYNPFDRSEHPEPCE